MLWSREGENLHQRLADQGQKSRQEIKMDFSKLRHSDIHHLMNRYPDAYHYLLNATLINEWELLLSEDRRHLNIWQLNRLEELDNIFAKVG